MKTSKLEITADEMIQLVNPLRDKQLLTIGDMPPSMRESDCVSLIENEEQSILSRLPQLYRLILSGMVDGQYLTSKTYGAEAGQTVLKTGFAPIVDGSLMLFKNYESLNKPWSGRTRSDAINPADYTVNNTTGSITLNQPLAQGDVIVAVYQHTSGKTFTSVRQLVLKAARVEVYTRFPHWSGAESIISSLNQQIEDQLLSYNIGARPSGIGEIDDLEFVEAPRAGAGKPLKVPFMGGRV